MAWEFSFLYFLQELHSPLLDKVMVFFTTLGEDGIVWIAIAALMLCFKKTRPCGIGMLAALILKTLIGNIILKNLFMRQRPCWLDPSVELLIKSPSSFSFPSGHTFDGFAASVTIFLHNRKAGIAAMILAAVIAFSRLYLFVHFPTDILASVVLGALVALTVYKVMASIAAKRR